MEKNNFINRIRNVFMYIVLIIMAVYVFSIFIPGIFTTHIIKSEGFTKTMHYAPLLLWILLIYILYKVYKADSRKLNRFLLIFTIAVHVLLGLIFMQTQTAYYDDSQTLMDIANAWYEAIMAGKGYDPIISHGDYLMMAPWNFGIVCLDLLMMLIVGPESTNMCFTLLNWLAACGCTMCMYRLLSKRLNWNERRLNLFLLLSIFWIVPFYYISFRYGWTLGLFFSILSIYFYVRFLNENQFKHLIFSLFLLSVAVLLKPNYVIVLVGYILIYLLGSFSLNSQGLIKLSLMGIGLIVCLQGSIWLASNYTKQNVVGVSKTAYLHMGLSESNLGNGWYNQYVSGVYWDCNEDWVCVAETSRGDLVDRLSYFIHHPAYTLRFIADKFVSYAFTKDFQTHSYYRESTIHENSQVTELLNTDAGLMITYGIQFCSWFFAFFGLAGFILLSFLKCKRHKHLNSFDLLLATLFVGGLSYHLLFETKAIYIFPWVQLVKPLSVLGIEFMMGKLSLYFTSDSFKHRKSIVLPLSVVTVIVIYGFYNWRNIDTKLIENYTYDEHPTEIGSNYPVVQPLIFESPVTVTKIRLKFSEIPTYGTLYLTINNSEGTSVSTNAYQFSELECQNWCTFPIQNAELNANEEYELIIHSDIEYNPILLIGNYNDDVVLPSIETRSEIYEQYLNVVLLSEVKGFETIPYLYHID